MLGNIPVFVVVYNISLLHNVVFLEFMQVFTVEESIFAIISYIDYYTTRFSLSMIMLTSSLHVIRSSQPVFHHSLFSQENTPDMVAETQFSMKPS